MADRGRRGEFGGGGGESGGSGRGGPPWCARVAEEERDLTLVGVILTAASAAYLAWNYRRAPRRRPAPYGAVGALLIAGAGVLAAGKPPVADTFVTPVFWTGYILLVDSWTLSARGRSLAHDERGALAWMAALSVGLWLVFEGYNLRLENWRYVGLPANTALRCFGYLWSFATIWPAVLETADFLLAARPGGWKGRTGGRIASGALLLALGAIGLVVPLVAPRSWGGYLFGMVWLGFALLLDPLNYMAGRSSVLGDLRKGDGRRVAALLEAGVVCGFFWEFWNYWAAAKWLYIFPIWQQVKIFEMPLAGYLGFPAFAVEVFAMYVYASGRLNLPYYEVG